MLYVLFALRVIPLLFDATVPGGGRTLGYQYDLLKLLIYMRNLMTPVPSSSKSNLTQMLASLNS
jgi:hypothetical protein